MTQHFTPSQVASMIGRSPATVRRLTSQYADQLSDSAKPPKGEARRYAPEDVAILQLATQALDAGISRETILAKLDNITLPSDMPAPIMNATQHPDSTPDATPALIAVLDSLADEITARTALESRLAENEAQREQLTRLVYIAVTVAGISLLVTIITLVAVLFA